MQTSRSSRGRIDSVLLIAAVVSLSLAVASLAWLASTGRKSPSIAPGDALAAPPELDFQHNDRTLLMWISTRCQPCLASMPFYQRLTSAPRHVRIVVAGREPIDELRECVGRYGLHPDAVVSLGDRPFTLQSTPTLVLVGSRGVVRQVWSGVLTADRQREDVLRSVN